MKILTFNNKRLITALAVVGGFLVAGSTASAFPKTRDHAEVILSFDLLPPAGSASTAAGTGTIELVRDRGVSVTDGLDLTVTGLADGTYTVSATLKSDPAAPAVIISNVVVNSAVIPDPAAPPAPPLPLPEDLDPFDIATLTVSDATPMVVLSGLPTENIAVWNYFANCPLRAPRIDPLAAPVPRTGKKPKRVHGHVLIRARILDDVETRRMFLLVAHGAPANTLLTINLDGLPVGEVTSTKNGKVMVKGLDGDFRIAGVTELTLTDINGVVVMVCDFFPGLD